MHVDLKYGQTSTQNVQTTEELRFVSQIEVRPDVYIRNAHAHIQTHMLAFARGSADPIIEQILGNLALVVCAYAI